MTPSAQRKQLKPGLRHALLKYISHKKAVFLFCILSACAYLCIQTDLKQFDINSDDQITIIDILLIINII